MRCCRILRQIIRDLIPWRLILDEGVELRANAGIIIEGSHANGNLRALRPVAAEEARAARGAKRLRGAFALSVDANQFRAAREAKLLTQYSRLHQPSRARVLATAFTMTITRPQQRTFDLESNTAAKTASSDDSAHRREVKPSVRRSATEHIVEEAH